MKQAHPLGNRVLFHSGTGGLLDACTRMASDCIVLTVVARIERLSDSLSVIAKFLDEKSRYGYMTGDSY